MEGTAARAKTALRTEIGGGAAAAAKARELLAETLGKTTAPDSLHDLLLLTTELITNAVRHGGVDESDTFELNVVASKTRLRVSVTDPGGLTTPHVKGVDVEAPGGMGLFLVEQLSSRWGVERAADGTTEVWFELPGKSA